MGKRPPSVQDAFSSFHKYSRRRRPALTRHATLVQGAFSLTNRGARATDAAMTTTFLQVAIGGALGASLRYGATLTLLRVSGPGFPLGVITVNVLGSFLMGVFMVLSFHRDLGHLNPFVMTGILGGFTTFSAFSLEAFTLFERGEFIAAASYVLLSVVLSLAALVLGVWLARMIWA